MKNQFSTTALLAAALVHASPAAAQSTAPSAPSGKAGEIVPLVDYHAHINSLMYAQTNFPPILPAVPLPPEISQLMSNLERNWNSASGLAPLFTEDSMTIKTDMHNWVRGRDAAAGFWSVIYINGFKIIPVSYTEKGPIAYLRGYLANREEPIKNGDPNYFGVVFFVLEKENDGQWRIASKIFRTAPPRLQKPVIAEQFLGELDAAGIQRANILSVAFVFAGSPELQPNEAAKVREENDWNAQQAARYPARLTAFCSFNPLKPYALAETESCGRDKRIIAAAMRRVGLDRILFGSDRHAPQNLPPAEAWKAWLDKLPFTEAEFRDIADNVVQYRN